MNDSLPLPARVARKIKYLWHKKVLRDPVLRGVDRWYGVSPAGTLLFEHRLKPGAVIFDVGGFTGVAAAEMVKRYPDATYHVFEPIAKYVKHLKARFGRNRKVKVHAYGVAGQAGRATIYHLGEQSSVYRQGGSEEVIELRGVVETYKTLAPKGVDMLMMNAEGAEYDVLDALLEAKLAAKTHTLLVQFHPVVTDYRKRYAAIAAKLARTHDLVFRVPFVWEKWVRR